MIWYHRKRGDGAVELPTLYLKTRVLHNQICCQLSFCTPDIYPLKSGELLQYMCNLLWPFGSAKLLFSSCLLQNIFIPLLSITEGLIHLFHVLSPTLEFFVLGHQESFVLSAITIHVSFVFTANTNGVATMD